jgi:3',5'-cyclic AMP phosphodiesterase CpdA
MRIIVHISDLHFGRIHKPTVEPLRQAIVAIQPHLLAVSGDLTQRARDSEFAEAREFLAGLPQPQIVVPGNHDVPLHNLYSRFRVGVRRFQDYFGHDLAPSYKDEQIAVAGANTARSLIWKGGRINTQQIQALEERLCGLDPAITRVIVTHHPFDLPAHYHKGHLVGRARIAMQKLAACGVDLLLAGHFHLSHSGHTAERYKIAGHSAIFVQAGTAISSRDRGEANSFNLIRILPGAIEVERHSWDTETGAFAVLSSQVFHRMPVSGWAPAVLPA